MFLCRGHKGAQKFAKIARVVHVLKLYEGVPPSLGVRKLQHRVQTCVALGGTCSVVF